MKCDRYKKWFTKEWMMGPNSMRLLDEMLEAYPIDKNLCVLDLGCGKGLSSLYLAKEWDSRVYAVDLWCSATENDAQMKQWNIADRVVPLHIDAHDLPFADNYFDAIVSIDSFHYFATEASFFETKILPFVKSGGYVYIAMPGIWEEYHGKENALLLEWVEGEESEYELFHSIEWWKAHLHPEGRYEILQAAVLETGAQAWNDWFASGHPFAKRDGEYFAKGIDRYVNLIGFVIKKL